MGRAPGKSTTWIDPRAPVAGWHAPPRPDRMTLEGRFVTLEPLSHARHGRALYAAYAEDDAVWRFMPYGPFAHEDAYLAWAETMARQSDPIFFALRDPGLQHVLGVMSYLRIAPEAGSIEVGHIAIAPGAQRTPPVSEAIFLLMEWAFETGYRRFEWKCDAANLASRRAAERYGLSYEGVFRQAAVVKERNRDTAWFAAIDGEWPALRAAFETWLSPENFDETGKQRQRLSELTQPILAACDPGL